MRTIVANILFILTLSTQAQVVEKKLPDDFNKEKALKYYRSCFEDIMKEVSEKFFGLTPKISITYKNNGVAVLSGSDKLKSFEIRFNYKITKSLSHFDSVYFKIIVNDPTLFKSPVNFSKSKEELKLEYVPAVNYYSQVNNSKLDDFGNVISKNRSEFATVGSHYAPEALGYVISTNSGKVMFRYDRKKYLECLLNYFQN